MNAVNTVQSSDIRVLTAEELDAVAGGAKPVHVTFDLGWAAIRLDMTDDGVSGSVNFGGGWHRGTIWYDDLPK